jgi:hypothetical protein
MSLIPLADVEKQRRLRSPVRCAWPSASRWPPTTAIGRDRTRLARLTADVPAGLMPMLIEALAVLASEGLTVATRDPDAACEALVGVALDLAR